MISIGFGLERLGLISVRFPRATLLAMLAISLLLGMGATRLSYDSDLRNIFRSDSPDYALFEEMTRQYPGREQDVFLLIEGEGLFQPGHLARLQTLSMDMLFIEGVEELLSLFSARQPPKGDAPPEYLIPEDLSRIGDPEALLAEVRDHPLVSGKLLSRDGTSALFVVTLAEGVTDLGEARRLTKEIDALAGKALAGSGLRFQLTGMPAIRVTLFDYLSSDQLLFKLASYGISLLLAWLFFHSLRFLLLAILPPLAATLWLLGAMGWAGEGISVITNVVPTLVMVLTFSNAIHMLIGMRRYMAEGRDKRAAIVEAVQKIGPATVLTSLTTVVALATLFIPSHPIIIRFAATAAYGAALSFLIVILLLPGLALLILPDGQGTLPSRQPWLPRVIDRASRGAADLVVRRPLFLTIGSLILFSLFAALYLRNEPHFLYRGHLPTHSSAYQAMLRIDEKLAGTSTLRVFIQWPEGQDMFSRQTLDLIGEAHRILEGEPAIREVWSLHGTAQRVVESGGTLEDLLRRLAEGEDHRTVRRLFLPESRSALVTGQLPDLDSALLLPLIADLDRRLEPLRQRYPDVRISLTDLASVSAKAADDMIRKLNLSLVSSILVIILLLGVSLRSWSAMLVAVLPNLLPIAAAGAYLELTGKGLQFSSIIVFTLGFGIAVDSTIHMLNHYRLTAGGNRDRDERLRTTLTAIGPALIVATLALMSGGVTVLSGLPTSQLYGQLTLLVLVFALIGDILILPALIWVAGHLSSRVRSL